MKVIYRDYFRWHLVLQGSEQVDGTDASCFGFSAFLWRFLKIWIFTTFCSTESYCFTVNYIVLPECGRHGVVSFSCGRPCQDRADLVKTLIKGILNRDFGRSHRWVTGGWGGRYVSFVLRLDAVTSPGLLQPQWCPVLSRETAALLSARLMMCRCSRSAQNLILRPSM